jgi:hypothetical protein
MLLVRLVIGVVVVSGRIYPATLWLWDDVFARG